VRWDEASKRWAPGLEQLGLARGHPTANDSPRSLESARRMVPEGRDRVQPARIPSPAAPWLASHAISTTSATRVRWRRAAAMVWPRPSRAGTRRWNDLGLRANHLTGRRVSYGTARTAAPARRMAGVRSEVLVDAWKGNEIKHSPGKGRRPVDGSSGSLVSREMVGAGGTRATSSDDRSTNPTESVPIRR